MTDEERLGNALDDCIEEKLTAYVDQVTASVAEAVLDEVSMHLETHLPAKAIEVECLESPPPWRWKRSNRPKCSAPGADLVHIGCYRAAVLKLVT